DLQIAMGVDTGPFVAAVVGTIEPAFFGFDEDIDAPAVAGRDGDGAAAPDAARQTIVVIPFRIRGTEFLPRVAAIVRAVQAAAAAGQTPRRPPGLPQTRKENARVRRIKTDVDGAGIGVLLEDLLPRFAAVGGAIDAALGVGAERAAEDGRISHVRIGWMHDH